VSAFLVPRSDVSEFRKRYRWIALAAFLAFGAVAMRLFQLQVVKGAEYAQTAHENVIRRVTIPTTRGIVRDAHGRVLASSRPSFNVLIVPGRVMPSARPRKVSRSGAVLHDEPDSWNRVADTLRLNPDERTRLTARIKDACRWTSGTWPELGLPWNELQNVSRHISALSNFLARTYLAARKEQL
jgi:penicillin-binding protein 2